MSQTQIKIIAGSTRENRFSNTAATWLNEISSKKDTIDTEVVDLRDYELPFFNAAESPAGEHAPYTNEAVQSFTNKIAESEAFIVVTPEYNHGTSGVLKNALDWVYPEWNYKPIAFMSYGNAGGARVIEQLRLTAIELKMIPIQKDVRIPGEVYFTLGEDDEKLKNTFNNLEKSANEMIDELSWFAEILTPARTNNKQ